MARTTEWAKTLMLPSRLNDYVCEHFSVSSGNSTKSASVTIRGALVP
jgi:hypothetical protein